MALGRLSPLQERVLVVLAGMTPPWTLSGGGALAGFHTRHRDTRDLDLFWQQQSTLGDAPDRVRERLTEAGLSISTLATGAAFTRLSVGEVGGASVVLDLVADPVPLAEPPRLQTVGGVTFLMDTPHQILVNKLCALLGRSEPRDLEDVHVLLDSGGDLVRALRDCPKQDAGFSPLTLAWTVQGLPLARLATALGWSPDRIETVSTFQESLVEELLRQARPEA